MMYADAKQLGAAYMKAKQLLYTHSKPHLPSDGSRGTLLLIISRPNDGRFVIRCNALQLVDHLHHAGLLSSSQQKLQFCWFNSGILEICCVCAARLITYGLSLRLHCMHK